MIPLLVQLYKNSLLTCFSQPNLTPTCSLPLAPSQSLFHRGTPPHPTIMSLMSHHLAAIVPYSMSLFLLCCACGSLSFPLNLWSPKFHSILHWSLLLWWFSCLFSIGFPRIIYSMKWNDQYSIFAISNTILCNRQKLLPKNALETRSRLLLKQMIYILQ